MSFIFFVGSPVWFKYQRSADFIRVCCGPFGFWILYHDFEKLLERIPGLLVKKDNSDEQP